MNINKEKLNLELPCDLEPFGYIEKTHVIDTKNSGKLMLIAFGALNQLGHYAPEFGGVALVCINPDVVIAIKHIPWDAPGRLAEMQYQVNYLLENNNIQPAEVTNYFYRKCNYVLPAQKQRLKEEYFLEIAEENKERAKELKSQNERIQDLQKNATAGKRVAKLNRNMKVRTPEEVRKAKKDKDNKKTCNPVKYTKPILKLVKKDGPQEHSVINIPEEKTKTKMVDGEELIPLDEE